MPVAAGRRPRVSARPRRVPRALLTTLLLVARARARRGAGGRAAQPERPVLARRARHLRDDRRRQLRDLPLRAALVRRLPARGAGREGPDVLPGPALLVSVAEVRLRAAHVERAFATAPARSSARPTCARMSYAIHRFGDSGRRSGQQAVMLYVHQLMGDGAPGEVNPAALGPAVQSAFRRDRPRRRPLRRALPPGDEPAVGRDVAARAAPDDADGARRRRVGRGRAERPARPRPRGRRRAARRACAPAPTASRGSRSRRPTPATACGARSAPSSSPRRARRSTCRAAPTPRATASASPRRRRRASSATVAIDVTPGAGRRQHDRGAGDAARSARPAATRVTISGAFAGWRAERRGPPLRPGADARGDLLHRRAGGGDDVHGRRWAPSTTPPLAPPRPGWYGYQLVDRRAATTSSG